MALVRIGSGPIDAVPALVRYLHSLVEAGHEATVLTWDRDLSRTVEEQRSGCRLIRYGCFRCPSGSLRTYAGLLLWQLWLFRKLLFGASDVVHACDITCAPACRLATWLRGARFVYDVRDPVAVSFNWPGSLKGLLGLAERALTNLADAVIVPDENRVEYLGGAARSPGRLVVLYNAPEDRPDLVGADGRDPVAPLRLNLCGYLHPTRGVSMALELARECEQVELDVVGRPRDEAMRQSITSTPRVRFHGQVPLRESQRLMSTADAVLVLYDPSVEVNRVACPNKLFEAMMLGKPVITNAGTAVAEFAEREGVGFVVDYGDIGALVECVRRALSEEHPLADMSKRARRLFEERYNWDSQAPLYLQALAQHRQTDTLHG